MKIHALVAVALISSSLSTNLNAAPPNDALMKRSDDYAMCAATFNVIKDKRNYFAFETEAWVSRSKAHNSYNENEITNEMLSDAFAIGKAVGFYTFKLLDNKPWTDKLLKQCKLSNIYKP